MRNGIKSAPTQPVKDTYDKVVCPSSAAEATAPINDDERILLPTFEFVDTILKRERASKLPKLPKTQSEVRIEGEWACDVNGNRFLLQNPNPDMIVFASDSSLKRLSTCKTIYMDGTFKTCPGLYAQFFCIHGLVENHVVPLVFALLSDKSADT